MKNIKKLLSLLLCGIMLFGMFPASLFAADGDTGDGSGTISETFVPKITWKRTFEYEHRHDTAANQHTNLGGLYAGDKTAYLTTTADPNNTADYLNKVHWGWADFSEHFNGRTDDVDDSAHKVWDYGHTDVQYADPVKNSITNPIYTTNTIGGVGIIPYAPSAGDQAIFAATWNNRAAQAFDASSVDGTDIYSQSNYVSVKKGQMDIGYGKNSKDSTFRPSPANPTPHAGSPVHSCGPKVTRFPTPSNSFPKTIPIIRIFMTKLKPIPTLKRLSAARTLLQSTMICSCSSIRTANN